ncbi:hypothetical protein FPQ18DRAFT_398490 [Pyronema domesticum]|uniref:Similar to Coiled-coil domain-containing protein 124 homolog acc. no. O94389 n=1 Tax=Pyronema omphalodes (strain CBS 100304) TaxID=1076935 RepID=U4LHM5_PYROM|nr:hypothetical protein FPQ18DRAFT_398490 [Pyronema domesticum]CCX31423.1 Similar to Coiled-coil domain-containing protein 124 homolog; acc. no. O94389 [Pyronema omphalodes CBS 100304]
MAGKKLPENSKKVAGNAQKAAAAQAKADAENAKKAQAEAQEWSKGAKSNAKADAAEAKKKEAAAKAAEKAKLLAEEEAAMPSKPKGGKTAVKRGGLDAALNALNASGIDDALDALELTSDGKAVVIDRHPERRFKAAYAAYKDRRLPEIKEEHKGLRLQQMVEIIKKEFDKHPDNPFNQTGIVAHNATREEVQSKRAEERQKIENRLAGK